MSFTFYDQETGDIMPHILRPGDSSLMSLKFYGRVTGDVMSLQFLVLVFLYRGSKDLNKENTIA